MKVQGLFLVAVFSVVVAAHTQLVKGESLPGCPTRCGNVTIEYPFGTSQGCYYGGDASFSLTCNEKEKLVFGTNEVIKISHSGQLRILVPISSACFDTNDKEKPKEINSSISLLDTGNFTLSKDNKFTGVGCETYVLLRHVGMKNHTTGCISGCDSLPEKDTCSGLGCCQTSVPTVSGKFTALPRRSGIQDYDQYAPNNCTYAFLVEDKTYNFSASRDLQNLRNFREFQVVLDWSIGKQTCKQVESRSLCSRNSLCSNSTSGEGYICQCKYGYAGNPYLPNGCRDIDECTTTEYDYKHNCGEAKFCKNKEGSYECNCPFGYRLSIGDGCTRKDFGWTAILLGTTIGFLVLILGFIYIKQKLRQRKDIELGKHFFEQNGGGMLRQRLLGVGQSNVDVQIFTKEGMKAATNGYDDSNILGQGGQGTVYKGVLPDNSIVAIKKSRLGDRSQVEQFINEVLVLSQINHRNVVKLLGCCLETEVPLLVYEFIANGTLYDHLHSSMFDSSLTWEHRLRIAIEVAGTLSYLHSSASIPIIHRDVKTANILLDENLTAKVADFGASRLIPMDKEQLTTMVQGTLGYLDPEYYNTGLLNEKSDVYSFGVVLMELLSSQKALCFERPIYSKHLVSYFASATKENRLDDIIDSKLMNEDTHREIQEVAKVAVWCTRLTGDERPRMKEVAAELEGLRVITTKHGKIDQYAEPEETEHLPGSHILAVQGDANSSGYDSIKTIPRPDIETGR